ncbi:hypothetical protein F5050DRAFT_1730611 [Lentinula boryana]|uniref:Secreted protein n=1 Tax=Lentinula boryana TaxID=40481 RepID=A0ABQ8QPG2_9AGAR|nr:hypothetical protein F5050DRAFT_1730611 [Lentinula boryana]
MFFIALRRGLLTCHCLVIGKLKTQSVVLHFLDSSQVSFAALTFMSLLLYSNLDSKCQEVTETTDFHAVCHYLFFHRVFQALNSLDWAFENGQPICSQHLHTFV